MSGIIKTDKNKCVGCNKCIMVCPVNFANNITIVDQSRKIEIDENKCIACGKCLQTCDHGARNYIDDSDAFWDSLLNGEKITLIVAPSFLTNYPEEYKHIFAYLKSLGISLIYNVALGADITSWAYIKYLKENKDYDFYISQPCTPIVNFIEKYVPNLIEKLIPIHSPAINTAIYLKKYNKNNDKIAFLSPCIGKKEEFEKNSNVNYVDYSVTFDNLYKYIIQNRINLSEYPETDFDNIENGLGVKFSHPGGLKLNLLYHFPELKIKQLEGNEKVYEYLKFLSNGNRLGGYDFVDLLNCEYGCNVGTAYCSNNCKLTSLNHFELEILNDNRLKTQNNIEIDFDKYNKYFENFNKVLDLNDFITYYQNKSDEVKILLPSEEEIEEAFNKLKKFDSESRKINCFSCGYKTCMDMAIAICHGCNVPSSCYQYNKKELELQKNYLEENENYIRLILEHLTESVVVTDKNGIIELVNKETEQLFGYSMPEYQSKHITQFIKDLKLDKLKENVTKEFQITTKNNDLCFLKLKYRPVTIKNNQLLIFIIQNITKDKEIEGLKNNFISMVSHELRTPLTSIRGSLGLLSSGVLGEVSDKAANILNIANNNSIRLVNLINDILDLEKIKAGKMEFKFDKYEVMLLVEETIKYNEAYAKQYNVNYEITKRLDNAYINVDKDKFIQILTNLLSNAAKFSFENEVINIDISRKKNFISVSVTNKGTGIPEDCYNKIFESFSQVDSSDSRKKGGTGLGLNITKSIVEKMGGHIGFESKQNESTTFYFDLPELHQNFSSKSVLICEDHKTTARCIKAMFNELGYNADIAFSGKEAEEFLEKKQYDLMTLDIILPDTDGLDLFKKLQQSKKIENLPIIIISAKKPETELLKSYPQLIDWVEKSFNIEDLKIILDKAVKEKNKNKIEVLHVENDEDILNLTKFTLNDIANITIIKSLDKAKEIVSSTHFDIIILDFVFVDGTSDKLIPEIRSGINKDANIVVFSAYEESKILDKYVDVIMLKTSVSNNQFRQCIENFAKQKMKVKLL